MVSLKPSTRRVLIRIDLTLASFLPLSADEHVRTRPNRKPEEEEVHRDRQRVVVECRSFPITALSTRLIKAIRYDTGYHNALLFVPVFNFRQPVTSNPSLPISIFSHCSRAVYPISPLANLRFGPGQELALKTLKRTSQVGKNRTLLPHQKPTVAFVRQKKKQRTATTLRNACKAKQRNPYKLT